MPQVTIVPGAPEVEVYLVKGDKEVTLFDFAVIVFSFGEIGDE